MYRIIGGDQKEYGPVSADEVRRWISERRLQATSLVQAEGAAEWQPLSHYLEFANALASLSPAPFAAATLPAFTEQRSNSMATTGLVFSCLALICCGCLPAGILGIVFSIIGLSQANRDPAQTGKSVAIAGIVIGVIALAGNIVAIFMGAFGSLIEAVAKH